VIADRQGTLDLTPTADAAPVRRASLAKTRMYLHLTLADLLDPMTRVGEVERLGPATVGQIREWLGASRATIVPVLHLDADQLQEHTVDEHDPPEPMRETVILRDRHCVFPWCRRDARACDLDHITPYVPIDQGGPPGQTAPSKLAPLCRRHHRAKTARHWHYHRDRDGTYTWHGPNSMSYRVTLQGTTASE